MKSIIRHRSGQRGFVTIAFAGMILGIMGFTGLAVDVGYLQFEKRKIQAAADAAAMGGLREVERGNSDYSAAGQNDAALNGFSAADVTVTYAESTGEVTATVQHLVPTFFMRVFGQNGVTISATAIAKTSTTTGNIGGCIFVLDPSADSAFWVHGTPELLTECSVVVNSDSSSAMVMDGASKVVLDNGAKVGVVGQWSVSSGQIVNGTTTPNTAESPSTIQQFADPLANVAAPVASNKYTMQVANGGMNVKKNSQPSGGLQPGIYCGGISIQSTNGTLTLNSGTYILAGGGMSINASANIQSATGGVMFYNTSSNSDSWGCTGGTVAAGTLSFNGNATMNLAGLTTSASTTVSPTDPIGILFFDDRNNTTSSMEHTINGTSTSTFDGALYFSKAKLYFTGTNQTPGYMIIVANTLEIGGNSTIGNDYTSLLTTNYIAPAATGGGLIH